MSQLPKRADVDERYKWDLSSLFESDEKWEEESRAVHQRLDDLREYEDRVVSDGEALLSALRVIEEVVRRTQRLGLYARLKRNEDIDNGTSRERLGEFERLERDVTKGLEMIRREIRAAGRDTVMQEVKTTPELAAYEHFLDDVLRMAVHARSQEVEELIADLAGIVESPSRIYTTLTNEDVEPRPVETPDGERTEVTAANRGTHLRHRDRAFRRRVYQSVYGAYAAVENTIATAYADKVRGQVALADARNYESVREMAFNTPSYPETGLHIHLPVEVHDTMTSAIRGSLYPLHRYYERRKEILGLDELRAWDLDVPLASVDEPTVPYGDARDHVLAAVEPLGDAYRNRLAEFFASRRIDVYETRNKQNIVGYAPWAYETGSYVLLNYRDDVRSMAILAHELGHAMHAEYQRNARSPLYATGPGTVEEIPSYVHELLLARHLLDADDRTLRQYARDRLLSVAQGMYGAALYSVFTHESYRIVENGEGLTLERIEELYADLLAEFRAPTTTDTWATRGWLVGSHARPPYHFYQYVLGITGALRTVERLVDGDLTPEEYHDFLRAGGTIRPVDAFETLDIDIRSREPFESACAVTGDYVEELDGDSIT